MKEIKTKRVLAGFSPSVGDVVLIKDNVPRGSWKIGRIVSLAKNSDGYICSGKVTLSSGRIIRRPVN